jgi:hypothetical protein
MGLTKSSSFYSAFLKTRVAKRNWAIRVLLIKGMTYYLIESFAVTVVAIGIVARRCTSESRTMAKAALFSSFIGILGCDLIVSGLMGLPFS